MILRRNTFVGLAVLLGIPLAIALLGNRAKVGPENIRFGRDACHRCHMLIAGGGFAGERRGRDGELRKYDDVGCLILALESAREETTHAWVEDHAGTGFVPLLEATLVRGGADTPMGYGIVAFRSPGEAKRFAGERGGQLVTLEDVLRSGSRLSRFAPASTLKEAHP